MYNSNEIKIESKEVANCTIENLLEIVLDIIENGYNQTKKVNHPVLSEGMKPIIWNESKAEWDEVTSNNPNWYDYDAKKWANVRTADGSMWVWIPRYAYQIATCYHTSCSGGAGTINVKFLQGKTNAVSDGTTIEEIPSYEGNSQINYIKHPAFTFGSNEVTGFWVAKFETSGSVDSLTFKPNMPSLTNLTAINMFTYSRNLETNNTYGWGISGSGIDTHMMKNTEWGAVAYLTQSVYGKNEEVWNNAFNGRRTGCSGSGVNAFNESTCIEYHTQNGQQASTTGNIYGTYDMSGGATEYVTGIYGSGSDKYYNYYNSYSSNIFGDAVYETSSNTPGSLSWYSDWSYMPYSPAPCFGRGGFFNESSNAGIFGFDRGHGQSYENVSWRVVVMVGDGL